MFYSPHLLKSYNGVFLSKDFSRNTPKFLHNLGKLTLEVEKNPAVEKRKTIGGFSPFQKYESKWVHLPQFSGWTLKNIWNHHLENHLTTKPSSPSALHRWWNPRDASAQSIKVKPCDDVSVVVVVVVSVVVVVPPSTDSVLVTRRFLGNFKVDVVGCLEFSSGSFGVGFAVFFCVWAGGEFFVNLRFLLLYELVEDIGIATLKYDSKSRCKSPLPS